MGGNSFVLEFRDISYRISENWILRNIDLGVREGETLVLLGRSGSGKTTLLKMVLGLIHPTEGEVRFDGKPTTEWDPIRLRRRVGYVIQDVGLFPHLTVEANIGLVPRLERWNPDAIHARVTELLEQMGLAPDEFASRRPRDLSGGQKQRVGIARALAANPPLLLLDEPFAALDPVTRVELQRQFNSLRDSLRKTSVFVTHDVREALAVGTRTALLNRGRLEFVGAPSELLRSTSDEAQAFLACLGGEWEKREA